MPQAPELVDHLFRREAGKMVSHLTRVFGLSRLALVEDAVQDALFQALQTWPTHGYPENPSAWLMQVARNRVIDVIRRDSKFKEAMPELVEPDENPFDDIDFEREIQDDQLRMMFACCHPGLSRELQVPLILKTLCGFSVAEIASSLLAEEDTVEKRLGRARKFLRESGSFVEVDGKTDVETSLEAVYQAIYLLFNEGYHTSQSEKSIREDLCYEALRLAILVSEHPQGARPKSYALIALFCFGAARLPGRLDAEGFIQLDKQDRSVWDAGLIAQGFAYLGRSASGDELSEFHLEARIASLHSGASSFDATDWGQIGRLYDLLYRMKPTPVVALNRAIAAGFAEGPEEGLRELGKIPDAARLKGYPYYPAALAEFHRLAGHESQARSYYEQAIRLARNPSEVQFLERKLQSIS